ncbi:acetyltransferase [Paenibacillus sp. R14(2021)]|uniref:acetyltransferase n=1 Tax=Paenibacillus sp. R14(2021) TaxID=2859228 RepID=UPI001C61438D|nr:acetyltransferase [Paenibacillus sp. R14(2021)]
MESIVIFGAGGHAKSVIDVIEQEGRYRILGILDNHKPVGTVFYGYEVLGDESWLTASDTRIYGGFAAIGDNWTRSKVTAAILAAQPSFTFVTAIHPRASVAKGAVIGAGSVLMAGAVVNADTVIGEHCVINTNASVDHDSIVGDFVNLAPNAASGGQVRIGSFSTLSLGAGVIHSVTIGEHALIGAGAVVLSDIESRSVAYGTPAKVVRYREVGECYL